MLLAVGWMVFTGRLIPRSQVQALERDRDHWRQIAMMSIGHTDQLLPAARVATQVSRALTDQVTAALADADQVTRALTDIPGTPTRGAGDRESET